MMQSSRISDTNVIF